MGLQPKNLKQSDCSCCPAALLLGLPPNNPKYIVRLQLLHCSPLAGPAAQKISSSQIAVAALQPSCWACHQIQNSQIAVAALQPSCWACHQIQNSQIAVAALQPSCWACHQIQNSQIAVAALQPSAGPTAKKSQVVRSQLLL